MSKASFLNEMLNKLLKKKTLFRSFNNSVDTNDNFSIETLLQKVLKARGEASSNIISEQLFDKIEGLDDNELLEFFSDISKKFDIDGSKLLEEAKRYIQNNSTQNLEAVLETSQPKRIEILSKLNSSNKGTIRLVKLREKLFSFLKKHPDLKRVDNDFLKLFKSWFNSGFLILKKINWSTPALILEKVIEYEAVHEINSWKDLRERLEPHDRLCFSFFHPSMQDEPLIFVVVALMDKVPEKIDDVLSKNRKILTGGSETTAVFYSFPIVKLV
jgi:Malonyl-CoA decarboxylase (MCD).